MRGPPRPHTRTNREMRTPMKCPLGARVRHQCGRANASGGMDRSTGGPMIDPREDFIRVYPGAFPAEQARALTAHLKALFAQGFGRTRQATQQGRPKTVHDDQQIWEIRDADASDYRGTVMPALFDCLKKYVDELDILASVTLVGWWLK